MKQPTLLLATALLAAASLPAMSYADPAQDVESSINRLELALNKGDLDAVAALYAADAVIIPSESEILDSRAAIRSFWADQLAAGADVYRIDVLDARVEGDRAYVSTLWAATVNTRDNRVVTFDGNLASVLERQADGSWKISMQGWN